VCRQQVFHISSDQRGEIAVNHIKQLMCRLHAQRTARPPVTLLFSGNPTGSVARYRNGNDTTA
jgi:hypothetical protein